MLLLPILAKIPGMIGEYFKDQADLMRTQQQTAKEIELAKQQYAAEVAKAQYDLNKTIVTSTGSKFKYFTFIMWFGPFMLGIVSPSLSKEVFHNLAEMPDWYVQSVVLIMFTVWGIQVGAPVVTNIFSNLGNYLSERRSFKLEKAKIDRKAYFQALRELQGPLSQSQVNQNNKLLDKLDAQ